MVSATDDKEIRWVGSSHSDLLAFPKQPQREPGFQLSRVQAGLDPTDWKLCVAKFEEAIYVLHCFQK